MAVGIFSVLCADSKDPNQTVQADRRMPKTLFPVAQLIPTICSKIGLTNL